MQSQERVLITDLKNTLNPLWNWISFLFYIILPIFMLLSDGSGHRGWDLGLVIMGKDEKPVLTCPPSCLVCESWGWKISSTQGFWLSAFSSSWAAVSWDTVNVCSTCAKWEKASGCLTFARHSPSLTVLLKSGACSPLWSMAAVFYTDSGYKSPTW